MHPLPHRYFVTASGAVSDSDTVLKAASVSAIRSASPAEFGGPGNRWSPETLLVASLADCFVLTFRGIARASRLPWISLECEATGTLDRVDHTTQFTAFALRADLRVPSETDPVLARRLLEKAEHACLIANSLKAPVTLAVEIAVGPESVDPTVLAVAPG
jgi:organic hydroperoxide reductase OsmC/OhrA